MSDNGLVLELLDKNWNRLALSNRVLSADTNEELGSAESVGRVTLHRTDPATAYLPDIEDNDAQAVRFRLYSDNGDTLEFAGHVDNKSVTIGDDEVSFKGLQRGIALADHNVMRRDFLAWPLPTLARELTRNNIARAPLATVTADEEKTGAEALNVITGEPVKGSYWSITYTGSRPGVFTDAVNITVDLGEAKTCTAVRIIPPWWDNKYYAWRTYYSTDNTSWVELSEGSKTNNQPLSDKGWFGEGFSVSARYWRVEMYQSSDGYPRLAQIMVYEDIVTIGDDTTFAVPWIENNDSLNVDVVDGTPVKWIGAFRNGEREEPFVSKLESGNTATHTFRGTSNAVYFSQESASTADIYVDDVFKESIALGSGNQQLGYSITGLNLGVHTLLVSGTTGSSQVDYFSGEYQSSHRIVQEDDPSITYKGTWLNRYLDAFDGQGEKYTRTSGSEAAFEFYGDSFKMLGVKSTQRGIFEWLIDGVSQGNVDCYNATSNFGQELIVWSGSYGFHRIRLKHHGQKNASATDAIVGIDRIQGNWAHSIYLRSAYDTNLSLLGRLSEMTNSFLRLNYDGTIDLLGIVGDDTGNIIRVGENQGGNITGGTVEGSFDEQISAVLALGRGTGNNALRVFVQDRDAVARIGLKTVKIESRDVVDAYLLVRQAWQTLQDQKVPKRRYSIEWAPEEVLHTVTLNDYAAAVLALDPVAYWRLASLEDAGPNGLDLTEVGDPTPTTGLLVGDTDDAHEFPGADTDYFQSPTLPAIGTAFTLAGWVVPNTDDSGIFISGGGSRPYLRHLNSDVTFAFTDSGGAQKTFTTTADAAPIGTPVFVVATHDGSTARIYVNGEESATDPTDSQAVGTLSFRVGRWGANGLPFNGVVDEPAIFDRALTPTEIANLYEQGNTLLQEQRSIPVVGDLVVGDTARLYAPDVNLTGDTYRLVGRERTWDENGLSVAGTFANKRDKLSDMLTRATRDLSLTTNTPQGYKAVTQYGGNSENFVAETGGSSFRSAELDFLIDEESIILEAKLRFAIGLYRSYQRDTTSGGGSTSGDGGSSAPTSGPSSASSAQATSHHHAFAADIGAGSAGADRVYSTRTGVNISLGANNAGDLLTGDEAIGGEHTHGISHTHTVTIADHDHSTPNHVHTQTYDIFEEGSLPGAVSVVLDGVNIDSLIGGPFTASSAGAAFEADLADVLTSPGWHTLRFESASGKGRITAYVICKTLNLQ